MEVEGADDRRERGAEPVAGLGEHARRGRPAASRATQTRCGRGRSPGSRGGQQAQLVAVGVDHDVADLAGGGAVAVEQAPSSTRPAPTPVPTRSTISPPSPASPNVCSPRTAVLASLATKTGTSNAVAQARRPAACPYQPRFGASTTVPAASTTPGLPTPMPSTGRVGGVDQLRGEWCGRARPRPRRGGPSRGSSRRAWTVAGEVDHGPGHDPVGGQVEADDVAASAASPTSIGGLPTRPWTGAADSLDQPLGDQLADEVGDGHPGQPAGAGQVGAAGRPVAEQLLEQQRPVVATGVLRRSLPRGAQRPANRGGGRRHIC